MKFGFFVKAATLPLTRNVIVFNFFSLNRSCWDHHKKFPIIFSPPQLGVEPPISSFHKRDFFFFRKGVWGGEGRGGHVKKVEELKTRREVRKKKPEPSFLISLKTLPKKKKKIFACWNRKKKQTDFFFLETRLFFPPSKSFNSN